MEIYLKGHVVGERTSPATPERQPINQRLDHVRGQFYPRGTTAQAIALVIEEEGRGYREPLLCPESRIIFRSEIRQRILFVEDSRCLAEFVWSTPELALVLPADDRDSGASASRTLLRPVAMIANQRFMELNRQWRQMLSIADAFGRLRIGSS